VPKVRLGDARLHWLKNVTEPIGAVLAREVSCPMVVRRIKALRPRRTVTA
jgi:hypothetical protein